MQRATGFGRAEMRGVLRNRRAQRAARQHADKHAQIALARDQFLDADAGDMQRRHIGAQVGVASLVQTTTLPVSATAKLQPVMPAPAFKKKYGRVSWRMPSVR